MPVRRVVTGVDSAGVSVVVDDGPAEEIVLPTGRALTVADIWGADGERAVAPSDGSRPSYTSFFPPPDGFRVMLMRVLPESSGEVDPEAYRRERDRLLVGYADDTVQDPAHPGLHATRTVDVGVVLSGEIILELDEGQEVALREGDFVVQNGTRHRWHNRGDVPCSIAILVVGARAAG